jgi:hypothetical protein
MDEHDRQVELALEGAEVGQQSGDFAGVVFVDGMQADQRIEQEQAGPEAACGLEESTAVRLAIEAERGCGDDVESDGGQFEAALPLGYLRDQV